MTQLTRPDLSASHRRDESPGAGRAGAWGRPSAGWDGTDLATAVRALEARKALLAGAVEALGAPDGLGAGPFEAALADPGAQWWPFDLARVHLLYGERLRRAREITRSRHHLRTALDAFEVLGASAWAERAAAELAATAATRRQGETGPAASAVPAVSSAHGSSCSPRGGAAWLRAISQRNGRRVTLMMVLVDLGARSLWPDDGSPGAGLCRHDVTVVPGATR